MHRQLILYCSSVLSQKRYKQVASDVHRDYHKALRANIA
jgi:hypothetical protein